MQQIKILSRPDNERRTQEEWINFFNKEKIPMISMPDIFQLFKNKDITAIESLRKDFDDVWLVTSTQIIYDRNNLSAKVIHNAGSNTRKQIEINIKEIPDYTDKKLLNMLETEAGLNYIRALINSKATKEEIIKFFTELSGKKENNITFYTPTQSQRNDYHVCSVDLFFGNFGGFVVYGVRFGYGDGLSRGVLVNSAKQSKFFSNKAIFNLEDKTILIPMKNKLIKEIEKKQSNNKKIKLDWDLKVKVK